MSVVPKTQLILPIRRIRDRRENPHPGAAAGAAQRVDLEDALKKISSPSVGYFSLHAISEHAKMTSLGSGVALCAAVQALRLAKPFPFGQSTRIMGSGK